jgi:hypothetical protein
MIQLEKEIETGLRTAIRTSLNTYGSSTPELVDAKIICFWLGDEDGGPADDASDLRVVLMAHPSSSAGYMPGVGFEPIRSISVDVMCVSQPDSDGDRRIMRALYEAVRVVFETAPVTFTFAAGITFGGMLITNGGAAEVDSVGQVTSFTVEMKISL